MPPLSRPRLLPLTLVAALLATTSAPAIALTKVVWPGGDPKIRAQDDMFRHANGSWLDKTAIPADKRAYGTFLALRERSDQEVRTILDEAAKNPGNDPDAKLIGAYYGSLLDLDEIERDGLSALAGELSAIAAIEDLDDVALAMARLTHAGVKVPLAAYVSPDSKDPNMNVVYWSQWGLGLPDREDFLGDGADAKKRQAAYKAYLERIFTLASSGNPTGEATAVFDFERDLAQIQWKRSESRDAVKAYNPKARKVWAAEFPGFPFPRFADAVGMPPTSGAVVRQPSYVTAFADLAAKTPIATWQSYFRAHLLDEYATYLPKLFRDAHHSFHGEALQGLKAPEARWQQAVRETNNFLGESIGKRFVAKHFPPKSKAKMEVLVDNLIGAYRKRLGELEWMTPATRKAAAAKLDKLYVKIGYPTKWRGYAGLKLVSGDAAGNTLRMSRFGSHRDMAEAGKPVDKSRWYMDPQVVNAYYNPLGNEIVFPAAILRPPFFDANTDEAFNYGAIGAVIGHEISHGFDDEGRKYDADGVLRDWWQAADSEAFEARAAKLIAQYNAYEPIPGTHVDGKLTLGENIADLAGVAMALRAYHRSLGGKQPKVIGGLTGEQRFFYGYARVWRSKSRPEWLRTRLISDSHSPEQYRVNGVLTNLDSFAEAFKLKAGDKMYKTPGDRVRIW